MPSLVIRLDPALLPNPDTDLRYDIPDRLQVDTNGLVEDGGFDYEAGTDAMLIYLETTDLPAALNAVVAFLRSEALQGTDLAEAATVGVSDEDADVSREYTVAFPEGTTRVIRTAR